MQYLLDTNICIYLIKKHPVTVLERFRQHSPRYVAICPYDLLIAGLARSLKMILVTNNIKEFERIADLQLENWVEGER